VYFYRKRQKGALKRALNKIERIDTIRKINLEARSG
jgi:hypothetical protein